MIARLSSPRSFDLLRSEGVRVGRGPLRLMVRPDSNLHARFAFAIPRSVGNSVVRNRIRRRLRAVLQELDRHPRDGLAGGDHLIRVTGSLDGWSYDSLRRAMAELLMTVHSSPGDN